MQLDNSNFSNIQARLETQIYNQDQEISNLKKEIQQLSKAKRDMEKKMTVEVTHCMTAYFLFIYKQSNSCKNLKKIGSIGNKEKQIFTTR